MKEKTFIAWPIKENFPVVEIIVDSGGISVYRTQPVDLRKHKFTNKALEEIPLEESECKLQRSLTSAPLLLAWVSNKQGMMEIDLDAGAQRFCTRWTRRELFSWLNKGYGLKKKDLKPFK